MHELIKTLQFRCEIGDDGFLVKIEVFQSLESKSNYYFQLWRSEFIDAIPTLTTEAASFEVMHNWSPYISLSSEMNFVEAEKLEEVLAVIYSYLEDYFDHCSG